MDIKKDHINFAVGPVQISEEISRIGADPVPYFRTPDFSALMKENEALLKARVSFEEAATLKPDVLVGALERFADAQADAVRVHRTGLYGVRDGQAVPLIDL